MGERERLWTPATKTPPGTAMPIGDELAHEARHSTFRPEVSA